MLNGAIEIWGKKRSIFKNPITDFSSSRYNRSRVKNNAENMLMGTEGKKKHTHTHTHKLGAMFKLLAHKLILGSKKTQCTGQLCFLPERCMNSQGYLERGIFLPNLFHYVPLSEVGCSEINYYSLYCHIGSFRVMFLLQRA